MRFSAQEEYGLRCLIEVARTPDAVVTIPQVAKRQALTTAYVAKLMRHLRRVGLVVSVRGQKGGFRLASDAHRASLHVVLTALGGRFYTPENCVRWGKDVCPNKVDCSLRVLWTFIDQVVQKALHEATLGDLLKGRDAVSQLLERSARSEAAPDPSA